MGGTCWLAGVAAVMLAGASGATQREGVWDPRPPRPEARFPDLPLAVKDSDNPDCIQHSAMLEAAIRNNTLWAARMWESSAQVASAWTYGSVFHLGDFDGCFDSGAPFQEQFCLAQIHVTPETLAARQIDPAFQPLHWGLCVPASCSPGDLARSLQAALPPGMTASVHSRDCSQSPDADSSPVATFALLITVACFVFLTAVASRADLQNHKMQQGAAGAPGLVQSLLKCFSLPRNWAELWEVEEVCPNRLPLHAFDGFRVFTSFIVVFCHFVMIVIRFAFTNPLQLRRVVEQKQYPFVTEGELFVFNMFVMGGFLTGVVHLNDRRKPIFAILDRYLRLIPVILLAMMVTIVLFTEVSYGPLAGSVRERLEACYETWWADFFFITNLAPKKDVCLGHLWYLSVDIHMFILSVVVLLPLLRYRRSQGIAACALIMLACTFVSFYQCYSNGWSHFFDLKIEFIRDPEVPEIIMQRLGRTHFNAPAYLIGLCLGVCLVENQKKEKPFHISKKAARALKLMGTLIWLGTVYVGSEMQTGYGSGFEKALFFAIHRLIIGLGAALVFSAMMLRPQGRQNTIMRIMARLSFSVYIFHLPFILAYWVYQRTPVYMNFASTITQTLGLYLIFSLFAFVMHIVFEMPLQNIRRVLVKKHKED